MEERFTVAARATGPCVILTFAGELDVTTAEEAEKAVRAASETPHSHLVLDLTRLAFMDSTGVRVLVRAHRQSTDLRATISLAGLTPRVSRIVKLTGLDRAFKIHPSLDEALATHGLPH